MIFREKTFPNILNFVDDKDFYDYKLSKEERKKIAAVLLISSVGFITLSEMAEYMVVSRATIINDLPDIKSYIRSGNLEVISHPNKGLLVDGTESDKRVFLMKLVNYNPQAAELDVVRKQFVVDEETVDILEKILYEQEHVYESFLSDTSFQKVLVYLEIMVNRIKRGEYIESREGGKNSKYEMARDILKYMEQYCNITMSVDEIYFFSELLSYSHFLKQHTSDGQSVRIQMITREFIEKLSEELDVDLNRDYDFFEKLCNYLEASLVSPNIEYEKNSVIEELMLENQDVVRAVRCKIGIIKSYADYEITENDIGEIVVHVCAALERRKNKEISFHVILACHAGIGTSYLLQEKLKKHFNFQIVDIVSSHEASNLIENQADLVISTVPLKGCRIKHITVSPFLTDTDYIKIGNIVDEIRNSRNFPIREKEKNFTARGLISQIVPVLYDIIPYEAGKVSEKVGKIITDYFEEPFERDDDIYNPCLYHLLSADHIQLDVECSDWEEAVKKSALKLLNEGYIEERYIDAMINNIKENGPYIVLSKGFALPHDSKDSGVNRMGMNLIRLKAPVEFDAEERDPVWFVCTLAAVDQKAHLKAFFHLVNLLKNVQFRRKLQECKTASEMSDVIKMFESVVDYE